MNLLLHIGLPKTGSTTLQSWLSNSCAPVRDRIYLPGRDVLPGTFGANHIGLVLFSGRDLVWQSELGSRVRGSLAKEVNFVSQADFNENYHASLVEAISEARKNFCNTILLSNENISERLVADDIEKFTVEMSTLFEERKIVIYLRQQSKAAVSLYGESLKAGSSLTFRAFLDSEWVKRTLDYESQLDNWADNGWKVFPRLYHERERAAESWDIVRDFESAFYNDERMLCQPKGDVYSLNRSLESRAFIPMRLLNKTPASPSLRKKIAILSSHLLPRNAFDSKIRDELDQLESQYQKSNEKIALKYFGRSSLY